VLLNQSFNYWL